MQAVQTARHLPDYGVNVTCYDAWNPPDWSTIDLVHLFQANSSTRQMALLLSDFGIPAVLSPVTYTNHSASFIKNSRRVEQLFKKVTRGIWSDYSIIADCCQNASLLLPNTTDEAKLIEKGYDVPVSKIEIIPNGVEERFAEATPDLFYEKFGITDYILFVGNIGTERKNAFRLLQALAKRKTPAVLIGKIFDNAYARRCRNIADSHSHIHLIGEISHDDELLESAYAGARLFVLPGMFETPGIAALEAALAGSNVAITKVGGTHDYFGEHAVYLDPRSVSSIQSAIKQGLKKTVNNKVKSHILDHYTWQKVAEKTAAAYRKII